MPRYTTPITFQIDINTNADNATDASNKALELAKTWLREIKEQEEEEANLSNRPIKHKIYDPSIKSPSFLTRDYK